MDDLRALEDWAGALLNRLAPPERVKLAKKIAQELRRSQQQRVKVQRNPDGTPFAPRLATTLRDKTGRLRRRKQMFQKLRTARFMKARGDKSTATVGFTGHVAWIARVHQYGLRDQAAPGGRYQKYKRRQVLGLIEEEKNLITELLLLQLQ